MPDKTLKEQGLTSGTSSVSYIYEASNLREAWRSLHSDADLQDVGRECFAFVHRSNKNVVRGTHECPDTQRLFLCAYLYLIHLHGSPPLFGHQSFTFPR